MRQYVKFVLGTALGVFLLFYCGAMLNFFPFWGTSELVYSEIGFCTWIICIVIAICTCVICRKIDKKDK